MILATNIAESSITIDDVTCVRHLVWLPPQQRPEHPEDLVDDAVGQVIDSCKVLPSALEGMGCRNFRLVYCQAEGKADLLRRSHEAVVCDLVSGGSSWPFLLQVRRDTPMWSSLAATTWISGRRGKSPHGRAAEPLFAGPGRSDPTGALLQTLQSPALHGGFGGV